MKSETANALCSDGNVRTLKEGGRQFKETDMVPYLGR